MSRLNRILILLSLFLPAGMLVTFALFPEQDPVLDAPLLHFYLVTFFTFTAAVVAFITVRVLGQDSAPRHRLLATAFAGMGAMFLVHGATTPSALIFTFNPGLRWGAWLTLLVGGLLFALASHDRPQRPLSHLLVTRIQWGLGLFYILFVLIVISAPAWLTAVDTLLGGLQQPLAFATTLILWLYATVRLTLNWRQSGEQVDGVMALIAAWLVLGTISLHQFSLFHLSWWLYHLALLLGAGTAVYVLFRRYEQLRRFNLTAYFAAAGLIVTAALALLTSHLFSQIVEQRLESQLNQQALRVGQNLVASFVADMPNASTNSDLRQMAGEARLFQSATWAARLTGLEIGMVLIYDDEQNLVYPDSVPLLPEVSPNLERTLTVGPTTSLFFSEEPLYVEATATEYLQSFVPIRTRSGTIGILSTVQQVPELVPAVVAARLNGLLIAGGLMGLLYLGMLVIVQRADSFITARNRELEQAYADLQAAEAMRDELADMIVHDLRSPLTSVSLSLDLLEKSIEDPDKASYQPRFFSGARESVQQMLILINQLLDVARLEAGKLSIDPAPFPIAELLQKKATQFGLQAEASGKTMLVETATNAPPVLADRELVSRVLDNLINNALKYTRTGGHVSLAAAQNGEVLIIQVQDNGTGIPAEAAAAIFDKFYQVRDKKGKPVRRGTGLGLSFCRLVVEAHNGRIWVESEEGRGSTFSFTLPLSQSPA